MNFFELNVKKDDKEIYKAFFKNEKNAIKHAKKTFDLMAAEDENIWNINYRTLSNGSKYLFKPFLSKDNDFLDLRIIEQKTHD